MKEGIYFNMPEEDYHNLPYFSNSGANLINIDSYEYWYYSAMNPERPTREESDAMVFGKAMHSMLLEPENFKKLYVTEPHPDDFPGIHILKTVDDLKAALTDLGLSKTGNKPELIERLSPLIDPDTQIIWEEVISKFYRNVELHGLRVLSKEQIKKLGNMEKMVNYYPRLRNSLTGGYSEVVIIWRDIDTGVMCKARLDYLRPDAIGDIKTFSLKGKKNIYKAMCDSIVWERYNMQYLVYLNAVKNIVKKLRSKKAVVEGDVPAEWMEKFLATEDKRFFFIFLRSEAPHQCKAIELERSGAPGATTNVYYSEAEQLFRIAISLYAQYFDKYGTNPWINEQDVRTLVDEEVPSVMYQSYAS